MRRGSENSLTAVLDTNLFVSGLIVERGTPFLLLEAWRHETFIVLLAPDQRSELEDVLTRPKFSQYGVTESGISRFFADLTRLAQPIVFPHPLDAPFDVRDPDDTVILAAAIGGRADYLVTGDNDLLTLADDPRLGDLKIVTARAFLDLL
jgi:putative PIN family toxin of toxin-antitoxin system